MCLGYVLVFIFYEMPCCSMLLKDKRAFWPIWSSGRLWQLAWVALPLGIVQMLFSLSGNVPRYFIERYRGPGELGIFEFGGVHCSWRDSSQCDGAISFAALGALFRQRGLPRFSALVLAWWGWERSWVLLVSRVP